MGRELADARHELNAAHHVPVRGELPEGKVKVEAHHAEFVIGPQPYVVQADGRPSATFSDEFDRLIRSVYEAASGTHDLSRFLMPAAGEVGSRLGGVGALIEQEDRGAGRLAHVADTRCDAYAQTPR